MRTGELGLGVDTKKQAAFDLKSLPGCDLLSKLEIQVSVLYALHVQFTTQFTTQFSLCRCWDWKSRSLCAMLMHCAKVLGEVLGVYYSV